jgi:predicted amidohydrolase YtcJ
LKSGIQDQILLYILTKKTVRTSLLSLIVPAFGLFAMNVTSRADKPIIGPDLIIVNATVHTMDPGQAVAQAIAILGDRIVAVGTDKEIKKLAGPLTRTIDAKKQLVLPGFNDSHVHFLSGGFQLSSVDLRDADSPQEFADRVRRFSEKLPAGRWITGGDWDHERWPDAKLPTKDLIDRFTPETPVFVSRLDGHMALANSLALRLAGVTRETLDPAGGLIVRDQKTGEPTGVLKDAAMS